MRQPRTVHLLLATSLLAAAACFEPFSARAELEVTVMEVRVPCVGFLGQPQLCLSVQWEGQETPTAFYDEIEGFEFEFGLRQRLLVERLTLKNPPADASSYRYRLLRTIARQEVSVPAVTPLDEPQIDG